MKKYILSFAIMFSALLAFSQTDRKLEKKSQSKFEVQITNGTFVLEPGFNFYLKPNMILRVRPFDRSTDYQTSNDEWVDRNRVMAFLEFRKSKTDSKLYFSHGPSLGYEFTNDEGVSDSELQLGYNVGFGYRINRHFTAGTFVSPYVGISDGDVDYLHGRLFVGTLSNMYLAYRF